MASHLDSARELSLILEDVREGRMDQGRLLDSVREWVARCASRERDLDDPELTAAYEESEPARGHRPAGGERAVANAAAAVASPMRFQVVRAHARGGLGEVYLAFDRELNRQVALKSIKPAFAHDPVSQSRFVHEAAVTGRLEHPGIVPIYGLGRYPDGRPYYVMRFIQGETLKAAIARFHGPYADRQGRVEREVAFRRLLQALVSACNTIAYAHLRGVVHRDLKPENIMLGPFGETLVVDWGMAKLVSELQDAEEPPGPAGLAMDSSLTRTGAAVGTPRYMSPEQASGELRRVGPASDVYGLGATLYCLLVGHAPFPDDELSDVLERVRRGVFPSPRGLNRSIDQALESICLKAMALRPEDRHESALALADELEAWLADLRYRGEQARALNQVKGSLCRLCIERAHNHLGRGRTGEGLLWLVRALENVPADAPWLEGVVRASLGAWHARGKLMERSLPHGAEVHAVAFSPDGRRLATACADGWGRIWDVATGHSLASNPMHDRPIRSLAFSPDGRRLATGADDGTLRIWNALDGKPAETPIDLGFPIQVVLFSSDGSMIATACRTGVPCLWTIADARPVPVPTGADSIVNAIAFNRQGSLLAVACEDGRVLCLDPATGDLHGDPLAHPAAVTSLMFHADGRTLLTGCRDGAARLWDLAAGSPARTFPLGAAVEQVGFDAAGKRMATACATGEARLWDPDSGQPVGESLEHDGGISCLAFHPEGTILATGSRDRTVKFWDTATGLPIGPPLAHRSAVLSLRFSPDGRRLATGSADGLARCWRAAPQLSGDVERLACWVRVTTELDFDPGDAVRKLDPLAGWELRRRLHELGGPPPRKIEKW